MDELLKKLEQGDTQSLAKIYTDYKRDFERFIAKYPVDRAEVDDIFQDSLIALFENAKKGKLVNLKSSLKTYLFAIGKYLVFKRLKKVEVQLNDFDELANGFEFPDYEDERLSMRVRSLQEFLPRLGEKCREIIRLSFYDELSTDEMVIRLGYPNKETLKSQKSRCLQHLKKMFNNGKNG